MAAASRCSVMTGADGAGGRRRHRGHERSSIASPHRRSNLGMPQNQPRTQNSRAESNGSSEFAVQVFEDGSSFSSRGAVDEDADDRSQRPQGGQDDEGTFIVADEQPETRHRQIEPQTEELRHGSGVIDSG